MIAEIETIEKLLKFVGMSGVDGINYSTLSNNLNNQVQSGAISFSSGKCISGLQFCRHQCYERAESFTDSTCPPTLSSVG